MAMSGIIWLRLFSPLCKMQQYVCNLSLYTRAHGKPKPVVKVSAGLACALYPTMNEENFADNVKIALSAIHSVLHPTANAAFTIYST